MYNRELKLAFIDSVSDSIAYKKLCTIVFDAAEPYEKSWGDDLCTRTSEELEPYVNEIMGVRTSGHTSKLMVLRKYFKYCAEVGYPNAGNGIDNVVLNNLEKVKSETVSGPLGLQAYLDKVFDPESELTISNIYRCFYWFSFSGMEAADIFRLKRENIDLLRAVVHFNGRTYQLYTESFAAINNALTLTSFRYVHDHYHTDVFVDRFPGDLIMRGLMYRPGKPQNNDPYAMVQNMKSAVYNAARKATYKGEPVSPLSISHAKLSGLFYRKYQTERLTGEPYTFADFIDAAEEAMREPRSANATEARVRSARNRLARTLLSDYETWKAAFNI